MFLQLSSILANLPFFEGANETVRVDWTVFLALKLHLRRKIFDNDISSLLIFFPDYLYSQLRKLRTNQFSIFSHVCNRYSNLRHSLIFCSLIGDSLI